MEQRKLEEIKHYDEDAKSWRGGASDVQGVDVMIMESYRAVYKILKREVADKSVLDYGCGHGMHAVPIAHFGGRVTGVDLSEESLKIARGRAEKEGLDNEIKFVAGDCEALPFADNTFDAITVGFGVRNFEDLKKGLTEMKRVLKPGGMVAVLEFSKPTRFPVKQFYNFYFKRILPSIGKMVSKDASAYTYLPESVQAFPDGEKFTAVLKEVGFSDAKIYSLSFGIASIYTAQK